MPPKKSYEEKPCIRCGIPKIVSERCRPCHLNYQKTSEKHKAGVEKYRQSEKGKIAQKRAVKRQQAKKKSNTVLRATRSFARGYLVTALKLSIRKILECFDEDAHGGLNLYEDRLPDLITAVRQAKETIKYESTPWKGGMRSARRLVLKDLNLL